MRAPRTLALLGAALFVAIAARTARAQSPDPVPDPIAPVPDPVPPPAPASPEPTPPGNAEPPLAIFPPSPEDKLIDPRMLRSWGAMPARPFVSTMVDVGFVYMRPRVSVGYGKPFKSWVGLDLNPLATSTGLGVYGGLRLELPFIDVRFGPRYFFAFNHTYLPSAESHARLELESRSGPAARFTTWEAEIDAAIPVGPGDVLMRGSVSYVTGVPDGQEVFEETLHVIVRPPLVWRARGGYAVRLGRYSQHSFGVVADLLDIPKRDDSRTIRVGPILRIVLSRRVDVRGSFVMTVVSPDRIGLQGGDFTELGVRYRWATE